MILNNHQKDQNLLIKSKKESYIDSLTYFFSLLLLSCMICISFSVIKVTLFSLAQETHPFNTVFKNTLGTLTNFAQASSVNFTSVSILEAAYLTVSKLIPLLLGIGSDFAFFALYTKNSYYHGIHNLPEHLEKTML